MSKSYWFDAACHAIEEAIHKLPADATKQQIEQAVNQAYPFGERRMHPYKQWLKAKPYVLRRRFPKLYLTMGQAHPAGGLFKEAP